MNEYYLNEEKELALVKIVRKTTPKWLIGNTTAVVFGVVGVSIVVAILIESGISAETLALSVAVLLVPAIGGMISLAVARAGGRDILLARFGEKVCLTDTELVESYTPRFRTNDSASLVENRIPFHAVRTVVHEKRKCRYVIHGDVETVKYLAGAEPTLVRNERIVLYEYFDNMAEILRILTEKCNVQIEEEK